jgi:DNA-binding MarR family transcriptional regulator
VPRRAAPEPEPRFDLADRLHSAAIHLLRKVRSVDDRTGLGPARLSALSVVVFGGPIRISALARAEQVRVPTITPIVAALEQDGLVTRTSDPADARATLLSATSKGARLMAEGRRRRIAAVAALLADVSATEHAVLARALDVLEAKIGVRSRWSNRRRR